VTKHEAVASPRLRFEALTVEQGNAFSRGDRDGQPWAPDFPTDGDLRQAHMLANDPSRAVSLDNLWGPYTLIEKDTGLCIGGIGFKGRPDAAGAVEIGYGICGSRQGQGFLTEAVGRVCALAREQGAFSVRAETDAANIASQRVLEKCRFAQLSNDSASIWWRLDL
jgi:ribosomal-protein-alanine N-acetyltransferase